jgi:hypothetical protein
MFSFQVLLHDPSVQYVEGQETSYVPLITTKLELLGNEVRFNPPLIKEVNNLYGTFKSWCRKALDLTRLVDVFYEGQKPLFDIISVDGEIFSVVQKILKSVEGMSKQCTAYKDENFSKYSTIWSQSREYFITDFPAAGGGMSEPDKMIGLSVPLKPSLKQFGEQIPKYRNSQDNIRLIQDSSNFGWLRVECRELKQVLDLN